MAEAALKQAKTDRRTAKSAFTRLKKALDHLVENHIPPDEVRQSLAKFHGAYESLVEKHDEYTKFIENNEEYQMEEQWLDECQEILMRIEVDAKMFINCTEKSNPEYTDGNGTSTSGKEVSSTGVHENDGISNMQSINRALPVVNAVDSKISASSASGVTALRLERLIPFIRLTEPLTTSGAGLPTQRFEEITAVKTSHIPELLGLQNTKFRRGQGQVDLLIGIEHIHFHAGETRHVDHLLSRNSPLGWVVFGGELEETSDVTRKLHVKFAFPVDLSHFWETEAMGMEIKPCICDADKLMQTEREESELIEKILIPERDQHVHRFLWRNLETNRAPVVYVETVLTFGDKPAPAMAQIALRKTAQDNKTDHPEAAEVLTNDTYMDDNCDSADTAQEARKLMEDIDEVFKTGGFNVKGWISNKKLAEKDNNEIEKGMNVFQGGEEKVLGTSWNFKTDKFFFRVKADILKLVDRPSHVPVKMTKGMILSQVARIYEPIGFAATFIIKEKIGMQQLWQLGLDWDEELPPAVQDN
ncbi:hypothetical protein AWC38_SpisGene16336 [Stylophora pistillata]|uniref:Uncharacterized protein n=1 Tax=Stylophora pistillata TaxID=50429 RepID=A0A2B4RQ06_STYPI|nr:hypothetical protein AWC38_SpisGene16336 [Stylophora pistillata]